MSQFFQHQGLHFKIEPNSTGQIVTLSHVVVFPTADTPANRALAAEQLLTLIDYRAEGPLKRLLATLPVGETPNAPPE